MFITYKVLCTVTQNYYIGSHKTNNIYDDYLGSGKAIQKSIEQYGKTNHIKEVLGIFNTRAESLAFEHELICTARKQGDDKLLNLSNGGQSFDIVNESRKNVYDITPDNYRLRCENLRRGREKQKNLIQQNIEYKTTRNNRISESLKKRFIITGGAFLGKHHSVEARQKISKAKIGKCDGINNSQFGTFWITNGIENKKWKNNLGDLPTGFYKGRKM